MPFDLVPKGTKLLEKTRLSSRDILDIAKAVIMVMDKAGLHQMNIEELVLLVAEQLKMPLERVKLGVRIVKLRAHLSSGAPEIVKNWGITRIMRAPELQDRLSMIAVIQEPGYSGNFEIGPMWLD